MSYNSLVDPDKSLMASGWLRSNLWSFKHTLLWETWDGITLGSGLCLYL